MNADIILSLMLCALDLLELGCGCCVGWIGLQDDVQMALSVLQLPHARQRHRIVHWALIGSVGQVKIHSFEINALCL